MNWFINAVVVFVVILLGNWLASEFIIFDKPLANLFFWSFVIGIFVGFGSRGYVTVNRA